MNYENYDSDIIAVELAGQPGQKHTHAVIAATGDGFVLSRGLLVEGTFVACESENLSLADNPELGDLYVAGFWGKAELARLLWPCESSMLCHVREFL